MTSLYLKQKTVGDFLKSNRKALKLTLRQIADKTRIRIDYLEAIEQGDYTVFRAEVHLKGFISRYASALGVDPQNAIALLRREREGELKPAKRKVFKDISTWQKSIFTRNVGLTTIAVFTIFSVVVYIAINIAKSIDAPQLSLISPVAIDSGAEGQYSSTENTLDLDVYMEIGSTLSINGVKYDNKGLERFTVEDLSLGDQSKTFYLEAKNELGKVSSITLRVENKSPETAQQTQTTEDGMIIDIEFVNESHIKIYSDGQISYDKSFASGEQIELKAESIIGITVADAADVEVYINGVRKLLKSNELNEWVYIEKTVYEKRSD